MMVSRLTLSTLVTVLSLGLARPAHADPPQKPVEQKVVEACPTNDPQFWQHWASARGYEHLINGDMDKAAECYTIAGQKYRQSVDGRDCPVCDAYERVGTIVSTLPRGAINLNNRETFEQSAERAAERGRRTLAFKLYELTALGWYLNLQSYGRFEYNPLHRAKAPWQNHYLHGEHFMEAAAGLAQDSAQKSRLLISARDYTAPLLTTGYCAHSDYEVRQGREPHPECKQAQVTIARLDALIRTLTTQ